MGPFRIRAFTTADHHIVHYHKQCLLINRADGCSDVLPSIHRSMLDVPYKLRPSEIPSGRNLVELTLPNQSVPHRSWWPCLWHWHAHYVFPLGGRRIIFVLIIIIIFLILVSPHFRSVNSNFWTITSRNFIFWPVIVLGEGNKCIVCGGPEVKGQGHTSIWIMLGRRSIANAIGI